MKIIFDPKSLRQSRMGAITAIVYLDFGHIRFPEERWSDFVVVLACWWLEAIRNLENNNGKPAVLRFMDGPYWVDIARLEKNILRLQCTDEYVQFRVCHEHSSSLDELGRVVRQFAKEVLVACDMAGYRSHDVAHLRSCVGC